MQKAARAQLPAGVPSSSGTGIPDRACEPQGSEEGEGGVWWGWGRSWPFSPLRGWSPRHSRLSTFLPQVAEILQALLVRPSCLLGHHEEPRPNTGRELEKEGGPVLTLGARGFDGSSTGPGPQGAWREAQL